MAILFARMNTTAHFRYRRLGKDLAGVRRFLACLSLLAAVGAVCAWGGGAAAKGKPLAWKPIKEALLRVNDAPVKEDWSVYGTGKKRDPLLIQIGNRFLLMSVHDHQVFEINPSGIEHKGEDLAWDPSDRPAQPIATSAWGDGDIGTAFRIEVKINAEDRLFTLELPHPPDVGALPVRSQSPTGAEQRRGRR
jgi:hypothetical protein